MNLKSTSLHLTAVILLCEYSAVVSERKQCQVPTTDANDCPEGYTLKWDGNGPCCEKCPSRCGNIAEARVQDDMRPRDGCFGECTKCSSIKEPYLHYKNTSLNSCMQCLDCSSIGKIEAIPCGETNNTICVNSVDEITTATTPVLLTTGSVIVNKQDHTNGNTIPAVIGAVAVLVLIFVVIALSVTLYCKCLKKKRNKEDKIQMDNKANDQQQRLKDGTEDESNYESLLGSSRRDSSDTHRYVDTNNTQSKDVPKVEQEDINNTQVEVDMDQSGPESVHFWNKRNSRHLPPVQS